MLLSVLYILTVLSFGFIQKKFSFAHPLSLPPFLFPSLVMSLFPSRLSFESIIKLINAVLWIGAYKGIPSVWKLTSSKVAYSVVWNKFILIQSIIKYLRQFISSMFLQQQWNALFFRWIDQIRSLTHRLHKRSRF